MTVTFSVLNMAWINTQVTTKETPGSMEVNILRFYIHENIRYSESRNEAFNSWSDSKIFKTLWQNFLRGMCTSRICQNWELDKRTQLQNANQDIDYLQLWLWRVLSSGIWSNAVCWGFILLPSSRHLTLRWTFIILFKLVFDQVFADKFCVYVCRGRRGKLQQFSDFSFSW